MKELNLEDNKMNDFQLGLSSYFPCLERLYLRKNYLFLINVLLFVDVLRMLNLMLLDMGQQNTRQGSMCENEFVQTEPIKGRHEYI